MMGVQEILDQAKSAPIVPIFVDQVVPSPYQGRRRFDQAQLEALANSIDVRGQLHAILVRTVGGRYEMIGGERRWRAIKDILKRPRIDAKILDCPDDAVAAELVGIDNLQGVNLLPSEKARQIKIMLDQGVPVDLIGQRLSCSPATVRSWARVADLPESVQDMLDDRQLKMNAVPVIAGLDGEHNQIRAAHMAAAGKLTVSQLKARTQHLPRVQAVAPAPVERLVSVSEISRQLISLRQDLTRFDPATISEQQRQVLTTNARELIKALHVLLPPQ